MLHRPSLRLSLLLLASLLAACGERTEPKAELPAPIVQGNQLRFPSGHPQLKLLTLATASPAQPIRVELPARLIWDEERTQRIYPSFAGRVMRIQADVGQRVAAGAALAVLASPDFGQAQSDTARAEVDERLSARNLQRQRELFDAGIVARKEMELAEAEHARAQAEVQRARARTRLYGDNGNVNQQLVLRASLAGVVVERNLNPGQELRTELSGPGVPALFVVTDPSSLWIQIDARDNEIGMVRAGQRFALRVPALAGQSFEGRVMTSSDFIDPQTRTIRVRGRIDNRQRLLKAEMLATAIFERRFEQGLMVPANSALLQGSQHWVFVQTRPGEFEPRKVELSYEGSREVVVASGLQAGEQVVAENALLLARQFRMVQNQTNSTTPAPAAKQP